MTVIAPLLDFPQVDLMNFRVESVRPLGREAAAFKVSKPREVDLSRLKGLQLFSAKNEKWRDLQLVSQITFGSS